MIQKLAYYVQWFMKCRLLKFRIPLEFVFNITSRCSLNCKHCSVSETYSPMDLPYSALLNHLEDYYKKGTRVVWFSGGEPLLWCGMDQRGRKVDVEALISAARKMGYFKTILITNGLLPIKTAADAVWVSVDGFSETHDAIRGKGTYAKLMANVKNSDHPAIFANMCINSINYKDVPAVIQSASDQSFKGVSFSFYTPMSKRASHLLLPQPQREKIVGQILKLKRKGYKIVNSSFGIDRMKVMDWRERCAYWSASFLLPDGKIIDGCPGWFEEGVCQECGFGMGRELYGVFNLKLGSIIEALRVVRSNTA